MIAPFRRSAATPRLPVLISVPHAGRAYTRDLLAATRLSPASLAILEDPLVDRLVEDGVSAGAAATVANAPRAEIDLNRALSDLDPTMMSGTAVRPAEPLSRRASLGLGLIPSRLSGHGAIWRGPLSPIEVERRIATIYRPYHDAIADELSRLRSRFGVAILLDCHSMPARGPSAPAIVLGDRGGTTCGEWLVAATEAACDAHGIASARNDPYAGGEIVKRHGRPAEDIHALQIEVDRGSYLAPGGKAEGAGFARISALIASIVKAAAETTPLQIAAE